MVEGVGQDALEMASAAKRGPDIERVPARAHYKMTYDTWHIANDIWSLEIRLRIVS